MTTDSTNTVREAAPAEPPGGDRLDLTAYRLHDAPLSLACAPGARDWMDASDQRYAYRCLPLLIANQAGWFIINEAAFDVIWDGTRELSGVRIRPLDRSACPPPVSSHFGDGIITFQIPYLFRTSAGYNLLVRGPSNWPKDGIQALEGLVEADWSSATFTMNWKITRPRRWLRFAAGEPVCMLVPQRRGELEAFHTKIGDLADNAELSDAYKQWAESRSEFLADLRVRKADAVQRKWQKHYFQGRLPGARASGRQHQTVLRLRPFAPGGVRKHDRHGRPVRPAASDAMLNPVTRSQTPRQKPDYRLEKLGAEILLYHPTRAKALYLNETASIIWSLCNGDRTTGEIAELLRGAYPEQAAAIDAEVDASLRLFADEGVVDFV